MTCPRNLLTLPLLTLLVPACMIEKQTIAGRDKSTFSGGLRSTWSLSAPPDDGKPWRRETMAEIDLSGSSSEFTQFLADDEVIEVSGKLIGGPDPVDVEFDLLRANGNFRVRSRTPEGIGLDVIGGLTYIDLDLKASNVTGSGSMNRSALGPLLGLGLFYEPIDRVRLYVEGQIGLLLSSGFDEVGLEVFELGASVRLSDHMHASLGWRQVNYEVDNDIYSSNLDLTASGLALGLNFTW